MPAKGWKPAAPNVSWGLFYDRSPWQIPAGGLTDCNNVRIQYNNITAYNMGWTLFLNTALNGAITLIDVFEQSNGTQLLIFGTPTDLYNYNAGTPVFITPIYATGTVDISNTGAVTGHSTLFQTNGRAIKAGDQLYVGSSTQTSPTVTWYTVQSVSSDTALQLSGYSAGSVSGQNYTIRQVFTGDVSTHHWASETFPQATVGASTFDAWFATNGVDFPIYWDGSAAQCVYLSTFPVKAFEVRRFKNVMVWGGLVTNAGVSQPMQIASSDNGKPTVVDGTGISGQFIAGDGPFFINHIGPIGNQLILYTNRDLIAAVFVGSPTIWSFNEVVRTKGNLASRTVVEFPDRHEFVGQDGQYRYNGLFCQLENTHVWRVVLNSFDLSRTERAFAFVAEQFGDIIWAMPFTSDASPPVMQTAYVQHYLEANERPLMKPFTRRDFPFTAAGSWLRSTNLTWDQLTNGWNTYFFRFNDNFFSGSYPLVLVGDASGFIYNLYSSDTKNGTGYSSYATFGRMFTANERSRGMIKRVYPFATTTLNSSLLTVTLSMYDQAEGQATIHDIRTMNMNYSGNRFTSHFRAGRLGQVQFGTAGPSQPWTVSGWDWDVVAGGLR